MRKQLLQYVITHLKKISLKKNIFTKLKLFLPVPNVHHAKKFPKKGSKISWPCPSYANTTCEALTGPWISYM